MRTGGGGARRHHDAIRELRPAGTGKPEEAGDSAVIFSEISYWKLQFRVPTSESSLIFFQFLN
jgi:hypothetical protein